MGKLNFVPRVFLAFLLATDCNAIYPPPGPAGTAGTKEVQQVGEDSKQQSENTETAEKNAEQAAEDLKNKKKPTAQDEENARLAEEAYWAEKIDEYRFGKSQEAMQARENQLNQGESMQGPSTETGSSREPIADQPSGQNAGTGSESQTSIQHEQIADPSKITADDISSSSDGWFNGSPEGSRDATPTREQLAESSDGWFSGSPEGSRGATPTREQLAESSDGWYSGSPEGSRNVTPTPEQLSESSGGWFGGSPESTTPSTSTPESQATASKYNFEQAPDASAAKAKLTDSGKGITYMNGDQEMVTWRATDPTTGKMTQYTMPAENHAAYKAAYQAADSQPGRTGPITLPRETINKAEIRTVANDGTTTPWKPATTTAPTQQQPAPTTVANTIPKQATSCRRVKVGVQNGVPIYATRCNGI